MSGLAIFSGNCLEAICGIDTGAKDMHGEPLFTGDIVIIYSTKIVSTEYGPMTDYIAGGITAVVSDEWTTYTDGTYRSKEGKAEYFVMGIKSVPMEDTGEWRVRKVKSHQDVVLGEHWKDYGFNYRESPIEATGEKA